ncbi:Wzz/FepE/Etk N-terminal domain-containing protein [Spirosoma aerophilum]
MSTSETIKTSETEDDEIEIRISDVIQFLKDSRRWALITGLALLVVGVIYAFLKPNQYTSQVTVMPELQSKGMELGGLGSLAGLAGIDLGGAGATGLDAIRPDIYPNVLQSVPFALYLLKQPVYSNLLRKKTSLQGFIEEQGQQSWLSGADNSEDSQVPDPQNFSRTLQITKKQEELIKVIHGSVATLLDKKNGIITVSATFPDPVVAAAVAQLSLEYLTNYITSYRTEKARNQVQFLANQLNDAKSRYQKAEYALSNYRDRNRSLFLETAKLEEQRLQGDFMLTQSVFNDLSKQFEQAKIKVSEESPVFKVLEPARIPLKKSAPKRGFIILGFLVAGTFLGVVLYGLRRFILNSK